MPKVIQVIESIESRGAGVVGSPCRSVTCYYTLEGEFLAESDPEVERCITVLANGAIVDNRAAGKE